MAEVPMSVSTRPCAFSSRSVSCCRPGRKRAMRSGRISPSRPRISMPSKPISFAFLSICAQPQSGHPSVLNASFIDPIAFPSNLLMQLCTLTLILLRRYVKRKLRQARRVPPGVAPGASPIRQAAGALASRSMRACQATWAKKSHPILQRNQVAHGRGDATRTRNTWFWRPLLYQLNYSPMYRTLSRHVYYYSKDGAICQQLRRQKFKFCRSSSFTVA